MDDMEDNAPDRDDVVTLLTAGPETFRRSFETVFHPAPTHPHPSAPDTPPGNLVAGPVGALFDRIRDAASHV